MFHKVWFWSCKPLLQLKLITLDSAMANEKFKYLVSAAIALGLSFGFSNYLKKRRRTRRHQPLKHIPRFPATSRADELAQALRESGVVVIENVVTSEKMDTMLAELASSEGVFHGAKGSFAGHHTLRNAAKPLGESKVAQELAVHPLILATIENILKPWCKRINLGTCSMISVEAPPSLDEKPAPAQVLHRDNVMWGASIWPWLPSEFKDRPEFCVSVMWAASDFTQVNGATRFIPGSHQWPASVVQREEDVIQATMPKGSVVLWCGNTLHGAGAHAPRQAKEEYESSTRHGLVFIYNLGWLKAEHNFHFAIPAKVIETFSPKLSELVGRLGENAVQHEWFTGPVYTQPYLGGPDGTVVGEGVQYWSKVVAADEPFKFVSLWSGSQASLLAEKLIRNWPNSICCLLKQSLSLWNLQWDTFLNIHGVFAGGWSNKTLFTWALTWRDRSCSSQHWCDLIELVCVKLLCLECYMLEVTSTDCDCKFLGWKIAFTFHSLWFDLFLAGRCRIWSS